MRKVPKDILESISIDCVIFGFDEQGLKILLIRRKYEPCEGAWALPGGFIKKDENLDDAAQRILKDLTGAHDIYMEQVHTFGAVDRYPLRRVITISHYALVKPEHFSLLAGADADRVEWFPVKEMPELPFDHRNIFESALQKLRSKVRTQPVGFELLPKKFSLTELQSLYEAILGEELDKRNFRKKILKMQLLQDLNEKQQSVAHRAATLYQFDSKNYALMQEKGVVFDL
jgi:8-oxo-dGTP diphosphatase